MKKRDEDKLSMYYVVQKVCTDNSSVWSSLPAFTTAFGNFGTKISALEAAIEKQETVITGHAQQKQKAEDALVAKTLEIAKTVSAYAKVQNDDVLKNKVAYSKTDLTKVRDSITLQRCMVIRDEAQLIIGSLGAYGVTSTDLNQLQTLLTNFSMLLPTPRAAITDRKRATDDITTLEREIDEILKGLMDPLVENFKATNLNFYKQYFDARMIVDTGVKGSDDDASTPTPTSPAV